MHTTATTPHHRSTRRKRTRRAALLTAAASIVGLGTAAGPAEAHGRWGSSPVDLAGRSFAVDTTVTFSLLPTFPEGSVGQACYTFVDDSVYLDSEFPVPDNPVPGTYTAKHRHNKTRYVATVDGNEVTLEQRGTVRERRDGQLVLKSNSDVAYLGTVIVQVRSKGYEVDSCD